MLDKDPWNSQKLPTINVIQTCEIRLPPLTLEKLKCVHLLVKEYPDQALEMALLLQYRDELWSVSLT